MVVFFTLEWKIGWLDLGFGTYYDHCALWPKQSENVAAQICFISPKIKGNLRGWSACPNKHSFSGSIKIWHIDNSNG